MAESTKNRLFSIRQNFIKFIVAFNHRIPKFIHKNPITNWLDSTTLILFSIKLFQLLIKIKIQQIIIKLYKFSRAPHKPPITLPFIAAGWLNILVPFFKATAISFIAFNFVLARRKTKKKYFHRIVSQFYFG